MVALKTIKEFYKCFNYETLIDRVKSVINIPQFWSGIQVLYYNKRANIVLLGTFKEGVLEEINLIYEGNEDGWEILLKEFNYSGCSKERAIYELKLTIYALFN